MRASNYILSQGYLSTNAIEYKSTLIILKLGLFSWDEFIWIECKCNFVIFYIENFAVHKAFKSDFIKYLNLR